MSRQSSPRPATRSIVIVAIIAVILVGTVSAIANYTAVSSGCSGYPPGGNCVASYSNTFMITVNYTGPWSLNYSGQTHVGESGPYNVTGTHTGTGYFTVPVTLSGLSDRELTVCAQAQKVDGSSSMLYLRIFPLYSRNTTAPYGTVSTCGGVAP